MAIHCNSNKKVDKCCQFSSFYSCIWSSFKGKNTTMHLLTMTAIKIQWPKIQRKVYNKKAYFISSVWYCAKIEFPCFSYQQTQISDIKNENICNWQYGKVEHKRRMSQEFPEKNTIDRSTNKYDGRNIYPYLLRNFVFCSSVKVRCACDIQHFCI